ncbi:MAG TPA: CorA family divalent cation transporter, partial [Kofleriaceae bacterium]|nr:CorA family divalent cation transporter [Kofleriaceae bacterium]
MAEPSPAASGQVPRSPASSQPSISGIDPLVSCVSLDFTTKQHKRITVDEVTSARDAGAFVWIDVDVAQTEEARTLLNKLGLCMPEIWEDALSREPATQIARYDDYLHLVLSGCRLSGHKFDLERVDAILGEQFLLTIHRGQAVVLEAVRKAYHADF